MNKYINCCLSIVTVSILTGCGNEANDNASNHKVTEKKIVKENTSSSNTDNAAAGSSSIKNPTGADISQTLPKDKNEITHTQESAQKETAGEETSNNKLNANKADSSKTKQNEEKSENSISANTDCQVYNPITGGCED